jgi:hypothetical protein
MNFRAVIGLTVAFVLITMMVCPAIVTVQTSKSTANGHCSSEEPQDQEQTMRGCCDQNALSVEQVHAPGESPVQHILLSLGTPHARTILAIEPVQPPYQKTGDHLSKLSTLRL